MLSAVKLMSNYKFVGQHMHTSIPTNNCICMTIIYYYKYINISKSTTQHLRVPKPFFHFSHPSRHSLLRNWQTTLRSGSGTAFQETKIRPWSYIATVSILPWRHSRMAANSKHNLDLPPTGPLPCNSTLITSQLAWTNPYLRILFHPSIFQPNPPNLSQAGIDPSISEISSCHPLDREGASPNLDASVKGSVFLQYPQDTKATKGTLIQSMEGIHWKHNLCFRFMKSNLTHPFYRTGNESTFTALITTKEWRYGSICCQWVPKASEYTQSIAVN